MRVNLKWIVSLVFVFSQTFFLIPQVSAANAFINSIGNNTLSISLYTKSGDDWVNTGIAMFQGELEISAKGIVSGHEGFLELKTAKSNNKWIKITKRELVNGRLIVTTEDGSEYTILNLNTQMNGQLEIGRFLK